MLEQRAHAVNNLNKKLDKIQQQFPLKQNVKPDFRKTAFSRFGNTTQNAFRKGASSNKRGVQTARLPDLNGDFAFGKSENSNNDDFRSNDQMQTFPDYKERDTTKFGHGVIVGKNRMKHRLNETSIKSGFNKMTQPNKLGLSSASDIRSIKKIERRGDTIQHQHSECPRAHHNNGPRKSFLHGASGTFYKNLIIYRFWYWQEYGT